MAAPGWGRAAGTALSTWVRLLRLKRCGAEAAPSLHLCTVPALLPPSPGPPMALPAQSRAVLLPRAGGSSGDRAGDKPPGGQH